MALTIRDEERLQGVHPDLVRVVRRASFGPVKFIVTEGLRSVERQAKLIREGKSQIKDPKNGRHVQGRAVDLAVVVNGQVVWNANSYLQLSEQMKNAALAEGVKIIWGGDWMYFKDGPHFELHSSVA